MFEVILIPYAWIKLLSMKGKQNLLKGKPKKGGTRTGYGEQKKPVNLSLTPTAIAALDAAATMQGISRSELIERLVRAKNVDVAGWEKQLAKLEEKYHVRITTPFSKGDPYFAGATPLGQAGFNGRPDYEAQGLTMQEAVLNLVRLIQDNG